MNIDYGSLDAPVKESIWDAYSVSSGTIGICINSSLYSEIDQFRRELIEFIATNKLENSKWNESINTYLSHREENTNDD